MDYGVPETELADTNLRADDGFPPPPPGPPPNNAGGAPTLPSQAQQISEPAAVGEAKNIDLDPSSTTAPTAVSSAPADTAATTNTTEPTASSTTATQTAKAAAPAASQPTVDHNGMSATSGPLDDSIGMGEYQPGKASVDDADGSKFLEKERDLENDMPTEGDGTTAQGSASVQDSQIEQTTATKA